MMRQAALVLNAGSSSIKFSVFELGADDALRLHGELEGIGVRPQFHAVDAKGAEAGRWSDAQASATHEDLLDRMLAWIEAHLGDVALCAVGHRVVHGGTVFSAPVVATPEVTAQIAALAPLAPLHQMHNVAPIAAIAARRPGLLQIACFDTAFHASLPVLATRLALPLSYEARGVRRYGFHGLSFDHIAHTLARSEPALAQGRVIAAHLGNGASLCALLAGTSVDVTTGFSTLDGLMMGTRCGSLDPGVILYLMQHDGLDARAVEDLLYHRAGLLGVSGLSSDMRELHRSEAGQAAVALFCHHAAREAHAMLQALGGLDGIVFTGGIGEHDAAVRAAICARLGWLGVALDPVANQDNARVISRAGSRVQVLVLPANEEAAILRGMREVMAAEGDLV